MTEKAKIESYVCLKCGRLAGFKNNEPLKCFNCGAGDWMSVERYIAEWPEPYLRAKQATS